VAFSNPCMGLWFCKILDYYGYWHFRSSLGLFIVFIIKIGSLDEPERYRVKFDFDGSFVLKNIRRGFHHRFGPEVETGKVVSIIFLKHLIPHDFRGSSIDYKDFGITEMALFLIFSNAFLKIPIFISYSLWRYPSRVDPIPTVYGDEESVNEVSRVLLRTFGAANPFAWGILKVPYNDAVRQHFLGGLIWKLKTAIQNIAPFPILIALSIPDPPKNLLQFLDFRNYTSPRPIYNIYKDPNTPTAGERYYRIA